MSYKAEKLRLTAGDVVMDCLRFGEGSRNFVIIPGLSLQSVVASGDGVAQAYGMFGEDCTVYLFDRRLNMPDSYTVDQMAEDTLSVIDSLGLESIDLYGVSQGGMISQLMALKRPELVRRLVLTSTMSRATARTSETSDSWSEGALSSTKDLASAFAELVYSEDFLNKYRPFLEAAAESITEEDMRRFRIQMEGNAGFSTYERLKDIKCPVFVIGAWGDRVTGPEASLELAAKLGCQLLMYPLCYGHAVYDEAPDIKGKILEFLR